MNPDILSAAIGFSDPLQHSLAQLERLAAALKHARFDLRDALRTATQLACQGQPSARAFVHHIQSGIDHPEVQKRTDKLLKICDYTDRLEALTEIHRDKLLLPRLYALEGPVFIEGDPARQKLVVVFTTMFNNFGIANTVLLAILKKYGVSVLLLRDCTQANYLGGASSFGEDLDDMSQKIEAFARSKSFDSVYLMGYSSGAYASCYASTRMRCAGHLVFSGPADFSLDTALPTEWMIPREIRQLFDPRHLLDLSDVLPGAPLRRRFIVGAQSRRDLRNAHHLRHVAGLEIIEIADCVHDTPETLIARGEFDAHLDWLFSGSA